MPHMGFKARRDPFEMLEKSHRRLEDHLDLLLGSRPDELLPEVVDFIDRSVVRHETDEEESLFPRLRGDAKLSGLIDTLEAEHRVLTKLHGALRALLDTPEPRAIRQLGRELAERYAAHIEIEEKRLFPAARELLSPADLAAMAAEMQERRGR